MSIASIIIALVVGVLAGMTIWQYRSRLPAAWKWKVVEATAEDWPHPDGPPVIYYDAGCRPQSEADLVAHQITNITAMVWPLLLGAYALAPRHCPIRQVYLQDSAVEEAATNGALAWVRPCLFSGGVWDHRDRRPWLDTLRLAARHIRYGTTTDAIGLYGDSEAWEIISHHRWPAAGGTS